MTTETVVVAGSSKPPTTRSLLVLLPLLTLLACGDKGSSTDNTSGSDTDIAGDSSGSGSDQGEDTALVDVYADIEGNWSGDVRQADGVSYRSSGTISANAGVGELAGTYTYVYDGFQCTGRYLRAGESGDTYSFTEDGAPNSRCKDGGVTYTFYPAEDTIEFTWTDLEGVYGQSTGTLRRVD